MKLRTTSTVHLFASQFSLLADELSAQPASACAKRGFDTTYSAQIRGASPHRICVKEHQENIRWIRVISRTIWTTTAQPRGTEVPVTFNYLCCIPTAAGACRHTGGDARHCWKE